MKELPTGWLRVPIGEIADQPVQRVPAAKERFRYIDIASIDRDGKRIGETHELSGANAPSRARKVIRTGDVLVSMTRPNLNAVALVPAILDGQIASTGFDVLRPQGVEPRWLYYLVRSDDFIGAMSGFVQGALYPAVRSKDVRSFVAPVAPLAEQRRILDKLEGILARVERCRIGLEQIPELLRRFREAVLEAALSGRMTEEIRANPPKYETVKVTEPYSHSVRGPSGWRATTLGEICDFIGGSQPPKSTFKYTPGPGLVRLIQIRDYKTDKHRTYIPANLGKRFCSSSDIMIGRYGPPIFQILRGLEGAYNVALMKAKPRDHELSNEFLFYLLKRPSLNRYVEAASERTAGQDGVRKETINGYPVFLPPVKEQQEIVGRADALMVFARSVETRYEAVLQNMNSLTPALLAKAFAGCLVPQDPSDESVREMLARIRAGKKQAEEPCSQRPTVVAHRLGIGTRRIRQKGREASRRKRA